MYLAVKHAHMLFVVLSFAGFLLRGMWMLSGSTLLQHRLTKIVPHVVDSLLLLTALTLVVMLHQYPFVVGWLTAKVLGLCVYIVLGTVALKRGRTRTVRVGAFAAAIAVFLWIVSVALTRQPGGFLA